MKQNIWSQLEAFWEHDDDLSSAKEDHSGHVGKFVMGCQSHVDPEVFIDD